MPVLLARPFHTRSQRRSFVRLKGMSTSCASVAQHSAAPGPSRTSSETTPVGTQVGDVPKIPARDRPG